jgi:ABC-type glutathione transport system ATPase component
VIASVEADDERALVPDVPTPVWGRDELQAGEMWNSNSLISWLTARSSLGVEAVHPPADGLELRAPAGSFFGLLGPSGAGKTKGRRPSTDRTRPGLAGEGVARVPHLVHTQSENEL